MSIILYVEVLLILRLIFRQYTVGGGLSSIVVYCTMYIRTTYYYFVNYVRTNKYVNSAKR
jgi:hypothetical protein